MPPHVWPHQKRDGKCVVVIGASNDRVASGVSAGCPAPTREYDQWETALAAVRQWEQFLGCRPIFGAPPAPRAG